MNVDSSVFALTQIDLSVRNLNSDNLEEIWSLLSNLISLYGSSAERQFLQSLISSLVQLVEEDSSEGTCTTTTSTRSFAILAARSILKNKYQINYNSPVFTTALCQSLHNIDLSPGIFLTRLILALDLSLKDQVLVAFAALHLQNEEITADTSIKKFAKERVRNLIEEFLLEDKGTAKRETVLGNTRDLNLILAFVSSAHESSLDTETVERNQRFLKEVRDHFPCNNLPILLELFLQTDKVDAEVTSSTMEADVTNPQQQVPGNHDPGAVEFVLEHGTGICATVEECRTTLLTVGASKMTPAAVARIMVGMIKAHEVQNQNQSAQQQQQQNIWGDTPPLTSSSSNSGKDKDSSSATSWNWKVFVQALLEVAPSTVWKEVFRELDYLGFYIRDGRGFRSLMEALKYGLQLQGHARADQFPIETFYRRWINTEGQLSLIRACLNPGNCDIFSFSDYPFHSVATEMLKTSGDKTYDVKEIAVWKSMELLDLLLSLSDGGHYPVVQEIFQFPIAHCPDILLLGLIQISSPMNMLRQELMGILFPVFLGNHINSGVILQYAWQNGSSAIRPIMIHAMAEWYLRGDYDQTKLSRILDVAQDLKALHLLLNANSHVFIIDLACLASRREFLKLDKWLSDKIREHGENFVQSLLKVLNRRVPYILGKEESIPKTAQLPPETVSTMIQCLHQCVGKVNQELSDTIVTMASTYNMLLNKSRVPASGGPQQPPGVLRPQHRNLNSLEAAFSVNPSSAPGQLFPSQSDPLASLGSSFGGLNLGGSSSGGAGSFGYNPIGPTPGSPSRLLGPGFNSQNPAAAPAAYPMLSGLQIGPSTGGPNVAAVSAALMGGVSNPMGLLSGRLGPNPQGPAGGPSQGAIGTGSGPPDKARGGLPDNALLFSDIQGEISKEAEDEANNYFHRIYSKPPDPTMSIDEVLDLLKRFQESTVRREREVYTCMLRNLFEEYRFFPQYPDKELHTTAQLFGGIIEHGLVTTYLQLGVALRFVVDALKKPPGSKMYFFGLAALDRFKNRLKEYPQYCQHLSTIPHFQEFPSHLIEYIEYGARSQEPPRPRTGPITPISNATSSSTGSTSISGGATTNTQQPPGTSAVGLGNKGASTSGPGVIAPKSTSSVVPGPSISGRPSIANATNITTLLVATEKDEKITPPPEGIQDKTAFIFNNLNQMNLAQKCEELREVIGVDYWPWVAQYLVMKRASIELNFHSLYSNLLDNLKAKDLNSCVLRETHRNIRILLRTDKSAGNFSDRALLKNLGHWLGMITVLKSKPIVLDDLDIKSLIIESYRKGLQDLLYVVPFAAKIMESCTRSKVFSPPCPWTMGILNVLAELHQEPDMKLNLKFEIEVLCKALNIEIRELKPPGILKDELEFKIDVYQLSYSSEKPQPQRSIPAPDQNNQVRLKSPSVTESDVMKMKYNFTQLFAMHGVSKPSSQALPEVSQSQPQSQQQTSAPTPQPQQGLEDISGVSHSPQPTSQQSQPQTVMTGLSSTPTLPTNAPEPKFSYMDIDTSNLTALLVNVSINGQLPLFQAHPQLKQYVRPSIEKGIQDLLHPVVDRSIKYTINACEQIIKKDFALDPDESRMRVAAHHMMRYLTAGMAMITSRDHIFIAISGNLKNVFMSQSRSPSSNQQLKDMIEQASSVIANDNMELACVFIQKATVEKALLEIDKKLAPEYETRKQAKLENRRYFDPAMNNYQTERIPEPIRVKPVQSSGPLSQQLAVYEDFSRNIPGFIPPSEGEAPFLAARFQVGLPPSGPPATGVVPPVAAPGPNPPGSGEELLSIYDKLMSEMDSYFQGLAVSHSPASPQLGQGVKNLLETILVARQSKSVIAAITLVQKAVEGLLEGLAAFPSDPEIIRYRDAHLMVLKKLQDNRGFGQPWVNRQVTKCLIESRPEVKYNVEAVDTLIRANLVNMIQFDAHLSNAMDKGTNVMAVNFAMQLVQMYLVDERYSTAVTESDLYHTVDMLSRVATVNRQHPEGLVHLIEILRNHETPNFIGDRAPAPGVTSSNLQTAVSQTREFDDPQDLRSSGVSGSSGLMEKSEILFREWIRLYVTQGSPRDSNKAFASFIHDLNGSGILKSDDVITRFFRVCVQFCVSQVYQGLQAAKATTPAMPLVRGKCYQSVDALVRLVALLIRHIGDSVTVQPKINLLNKFLGIVAGLLIQDHELQKSEFQQLPFHRLFMMLFQDLNQTDPVFEAIGTQILAGFSNILHILNPHKVPGFVYAWLEIIGNRTFIARMLALAADQKCWAMYCQLLLDLFKFLQPYLRNADLAKPVATLYRGTLRVLLVILHDFPDFLCDYCYHFLDAIPPNCIQMRNLVLSAFPRNMRLPDPFTANLKFEMLADTAMPPRVILNVGGMIQPAKFKQDLDSYLRTRGPVTFLSELRTNLQVINEVGTRYNIPLLNALVLFVGSQHILAIRGRGQTPSMSTIAHTSHMDIFQNLAVDLDTEGRYLFLNALANQLRFPSSHTHYFSLVILYLFAQSNTEVVQEQITRVLLERLVVNRPHPWGLLVTFIELIKNPMYKFWQHEFVHCAPEVEKLFESVARSCMVTKNTPPGSAQPTMNLSTSAQSVGGGTPGLIMPMDGSGEMMGLD